jgi:hypothetical protein
MNYKKLAEISQAQVAVLMETVKDLSSTVKSLTAEVSELKKVLLEKGKSKEEIERKLNGLLKIHLPKKIEKRNTVDTTLKINKPTLTPKERGNNGSKRKEYYDLVVIEDTLEPTHPAFVKADATYLFTRDVIRYEYIPQKLIKHIYKCKSYRVGDRVYDAKTPVSPFLNSNYDSSVIADLIQKRFVYGLPVERIIRYYSEMGFDLPKSTAHGLLTKAAELLDRLNPVLKEAILSDSYIHFDETYHTVLDKKYAKGSFKGYLWTALSSRHKLINYIYDNGSRSTKVFTSYLPKTYSGAIQADGYISYKKLDGWDYPKAIRLGCVQHCKRYFIEIDDLKEATDIIDTYNKFYLIRRNYPKDKWIEKSLMVYDELKAKLKALEKSKNCLPDSKLSKAVAYCLNELEAIGNIINSTDYDLDNNQIERPMRYISMSRKNSMFCGSQKGATRMALIYSLAISCRLNQVNTFSYFCDIINKLAILSPKASNEQLRELLPDKWAKE